MNRLELFNVDLDCWSACVCFRQTLKCLLCWDVFHRLWATNPLWLQIWEVCKSELQPPRRDPSPLCRLFMCQLTIWLTLPLLPLLPILMPQLCCLGRWVHSWMGWMSWPSKDVSWCVYILNLVWAMIISKLENRYFISVLWYLGTF